MEQSKASMLRQKQFEVNENETKVALLKSMIRDFDNVIGLLEQQIAAEEERTRIRDPRHPAAKRRQNLLISVAHTRSMLDVAEREFDQLTAQLSDLEPIHNKQLSAA